MCPWTSHHSIDSRWRDSPHVGWMVKVERYWPRDDCRPALHVHFRIDWEAPAAAKATVFSCQTMLPSHFTFPLSQQSRIQMLKLDCFSQIMSTSFLLCSPVPLFSHLPFHATQKMCLKRVSKNWRWWGIVLTDQLFFASRTLVFTQTDYLSTRD